VIEQITYLFFLRGLDSDQTREENKALRLKAAPVRIYPAGLDAQGRSYEDLRWSRFKNFAPAEMFVVLSERVFPFLRSLNDEKAGSSVARTTLVHT
jgi:type I restriction enzyme M protein